MALTASASSAACRRHLRLAIKSFGDSHERRLNTADDVIRKCVRVRMLGCFWPKRRGEHIKQLCVCKPSKCLLRVDFCNTASKYRGHMRLYTRLVVFMRVALNEVCEIQLVIRRRDGKQNE